MRRVEYIGKCRPYDLKNNFQCRPKSRVTKITIFQPFITIQQLRSTTERLYEVKLRLPAFTCAKYKLQNRTDRQFKIMPGPDDNSMILFEPTWYTDKTYLVLVELIENMHWDYILHIEDWF